MKSTRDFGGAALAAAAAALFATTPLQLSAHEDAEEHAKLEGKCIGGNACKGQGACRTANNQCAGENACKGQGFSMATKSDCEEQGGEFEEV
ncbi:MAG: hypothetical protein QNJ73_08770 [Gammaproteobacteria bacterium]|nr:hypothetical protein [Gammaproteobacteria bacterium]